LAINVVVTCVLSLVPTLSGTSLAAAQSNPTCTQLVVAATSVGGADGVGSVTIVLVNAGGRCGLLGYPTIQFFEPSSTHLVGHDVHRATMVFAEPVPRRVTLARGAVASVGVSWSDDPQAHQTCSRTRWVNVVMPSSTQLNYQPSLNALPCGSAIWVTPIEAGVRPRLS
jgi:hypothetical protein